MDLLDAYEEQQEERGQERFIKQQQATSLVDQNFAGTGIRDRVSVSMDGQKPVVEKEGRLSDSELDTFRDTTSQFSTFVQGPGPNVNEVKQNQLENVPDPRDVHQDRSARAKEQDERMSAPLTNDPVKYSKNPDEYDWPGVDTPPESDASDAVTLDEFNSLF